MAEERVQRRLAAILAANVVGYSRLMEQDETGTLTRLKSLRSEVFDPTTKRFDGRIFKNTGDGALVEFGSAVDAVQCAVEIQRALALRNADLPEDKRITLRIGISLGDVIVEGDDLFGNGVNIAARMESLAEPGAICVSGNVHEHIVNALDVTFEDLGEQAVKNLDRPVRSYRVNLEPAAADPEIEQPDTPPSLPDKPSIAVLPFENMSGDPEQEYFSDGITEDIITGLSRIRWFFVIARNSSFTYKGQSADVRRVAEELGVRYVLEGSVRKVGNQVRITAQLIDGVTGNHVWAERYDRNLEDIFAVQDEITQTVVGAIEPELSRAEQSRARLKPPDNLDAWDCHLHGLSHVWRFNKADNQKARRFFERAVEHDSEFCAAYAGLAYAHEQAYGLGVSDAPEQSLEAAAMAARQAISLDERDAFACWAMGGVPYMRRDYNAAIEWLRRSISLNPSFAPSYGWLGAALISLGRIEDGIKNLVTAERLSPKDPLLWSIYMFRSAAHWDAREWEQAEAWSSRSVATPNASLWAHCAHTAMLGHLGRLDEAQRASEEILRLKPDFSLAFLMRTPPYSEQHAMVLKEGLEKTGWQG